MAGWGVKFESYVQSWEGGVRNTARKDLLSPSAVPYVENGELVHIGDGTAVVRRRKGMRLLVSGLDDTSEITAIIPFDSVTSDGTVTRYLVAVTETRVYMLDPDTFSPTFYPGNVLFSSAPASEDYTTIGNAYVSWATANNRLYITRGERITGDNIASSANAYVGQFTGSAWYQAGMAAVSKVTGEITPHWSVAVGAVGGMTGDYDIFATYYSSITGAESSQSTDYESVTGLTTDTIDFTLEALGATSAPGHADKINIYLRKPSISTNFYRVAQINITAGTTNIDIDDDEYNALTTTGPDEYENNRPPQTGYLLCWHNGRMFLADSGTVYYSKVGYPEAWDPEHYEDVFSEDGEAITALLSHNGSLIVLKENSVNAIIGDSPSNWEVKKLYSGGIGCISKGATVQADGLLYWWGPDGPLVWDGVSEPKRLGKAIVEDFVKKEMWNAKYRGFIRGVLDVENERILWTFPMVRDGVVPDTNSAILSYKYRLGIFEGVWTGPRISCLSVFRGTGGRNEILAGSHDGRIYRLNDGWLDGVLASQNYTGTASLTAGATTITTTGLDEAPGYVGEYVTIYDTTTHEPLLRTRITANTTTTLTLAEPIPETGSFTYCIGAIPFVFDTMWVDDGAQFHKKRYEFAFLQLQADQDSQAWLTASFDWEGGERRTQTLTLTPPAVAQYATWDSSLWDASVWTTITPQYERWRMARVGRTWRIRVFFVDPFVEFQVLKVGMGGEYLTTKR